jgi:hypothetical protein
VVKVRKGENTVLGGEFPTALIYPAGIYGKCITVGVASALAEEPLQRRIN